MGGELRIYVDVQMRKKRNVRSVIGWLLRRQLSEPGAGGAVCAGSMASLLRCEVVSCPARLMGNALVSFTWLHFSGTGRRVGDRRLVELACPPAAFPARHRRFPPEA